MKWRVTWRNLEQKEDNVIVKADSVYLDNGTLVFTRLAGKSGAVMVAAFSNCEWNRVEEVMPEDD